MVDDGTGAGRRGDDAAARPGKGSARRKGAGPNGGGRRPGTKTARRQFHLRERTSKRLDVHCSLAERNESAFVDEVLESWLARFGQGRELWASEGRGPQIAPDDGEDRQELPAA